MVKKHSLNHQIWGIAWPAILSNISVPLLGLVDTAILGHLGTTQYLGAVAIGGAILSFLYWGFSFLRMGTTGLVAKAMGAGEADRALLLLAQSVVLALGLALLVFVLHPLWLPLGLAWMAPPAQIMPLAGSYAGIRIYSAPAVLTTYACVGWFIGRSNTRWPMVIAIATNALNIALDFLFILGLGLNSDGAAMATVIAEYTGCIIALIAVARATGHVDVPGLLHHLWQPRAYRELLRSNRHLFVRTICLLFSFAFFTAISGKLGVNVLAANTIALQLLLFAAYGMDGFAFAAEALTGTRIGARDIEGFRAAARGCARWCAITAAGMTLLLALGHGQLFAVLTNIPEVVDLLMDYRWWLIALPLVAAPSYLLDGIFIGTAETRYMMYTMLGCTTLVYLPLYYLLQPWGNHGLWLAFTAFNGMRGISLYLCYRSIDKRQGWLHTPKRTAPA